MDELQNEKQSSANQSSSSSLPPDELQAQVQKLTGERDEYLDGWRRSKADFINYKKEEAKRIEEVVSFGNISIIKELLAVLDSFDLASGAFTHDEQARKGEVKAIQYCEKLFDNRYITKRNHLFNTFRFFFLIIDKISFRSAPSIKVLVALTR
jgi:molecular chaperone GrpE (heat shock protein)